ncbi:uncharacterized protein DDB_G0280205-like [Cydia fagiglandana]|uniref:uncharacterized protein DDB_G0280205-like n=1 Tax=Cydia fagiglandana TaxID=1458189 RepID=UPI002FEE5D62
MLRAAWWTFVVLALWIAGAGARVYERCELARNLRGLGVRADHVATWICIAFHESRFDTAARNPHSGDHGLLQISELYWCGDGKACGLSCEALLDDDISDDVACALHVYEEHTRLQGDGFLAWVVYPQHCKHNTKKYLADCDDALKNASTKPMEKSRALDIPRRTMNLTLRLNQSIDELLPPYISMTSNSGHSRNEINFQDKNYKSKWQVTHFSNIDDLSPPVFGLRTYQKTESPPISTFALHELDQSKGIDKNELRNKFVTDKPARTTVNHFNKLGPVTTKILTSSSSSWYTLPSPSSTTAKPKQTLMPSTVKTTTTGRPPDRTTNLYRTTLIRNSKSDELLKEMPALSDKDSSKKRFRCVGCRIPTTENPISSSRLTTIPEPPTTSIPKGAFKTSATNRTFSARTIVSTTTVMPSKNRSARDNITSLMTTTPNTVTGRSKITTAYTTKPRNKVTSRNSFTTSSFKMPITLTTTPRAVTNRSTTTSSSSRHWRTLTSESAADSSEDTKNSQRNAIFDLYLKPTQPKLMTFKFATQSDSVYRRRIFADGTTSPATPWKRNGAQEFRIK